MISWKSDESPEIRSNRPKSDRIARNRTESPENRHFAHKSHGVTTCSNESVLDQKSVEIGTNQKNKTNMVVHKTQVFKPKSSQWTSNGPQKQPFFRAPDRSWQGLLVETKKTTLFFLFYFQFLSSGDWGGVRFVAHSR